MCTSRRYDIKNCLINIKQFLKAKEKTEILRENYPFFHHFLKKFERSVSTKKNMETLKFCKKSEKRN